MVNRGQHLGLVGFRQSYLLQTGAAAASCSSCIESWSTKAEAHSNEEISPPGVGASGSFVAGGADDGARPVASAVGVDRGVAGRRYCTCNRTPQQPAPVWAHADRRRSCDSVVGHAHSGPPRPAPCLPVVEAAAAPGCWVVGSRPVAALLQTLPGPRPPTDVVAAVCTRMRI